MLVMAAVNAQKRCWSTEYKPFFLIENQEIIMSIFNQSVVLNLVLYLYTIKKFLYCASDGLKVYRCDHCSMNL